MGQAVESDDVGAVPRVAARRARMLARSVVVALGLFTLALLGYPLNDLITTSYPAGVAAFAWGGLAVATGLHVAVTVTVLTGREPTWRVRAAVGVETVLFLVLLAALGLGWIQVPLFALADILLVLTGAWRVAATLAMIAVYAVLTAPLLITSEWLGSGWFFLLFGAIYYGLVALVRLAQDLEAARMGLARVAVGRERLRVARDLHDSLGHSLSVVLLKLELAERLHSRDTERSAREVGEARRLLRSAVEEMQDLVSGMRDRSLQAEVENARAVLASAGIDTTVHGPDVAVRSAAADALAWVVREAVTNILRHSCASRCKIGVLAADGFLEVTVSNDGAAPAPARVPSGGHGLDGLRERLGVVGGALSTATAQDGSFVLTARAPMDLP